MNVTCPQCGAEHELGESNELRENWELRTVRNDQGEKVEERVLKINCDAPGPDPETHHVFEIVEPVEAS